MSDENQVPQQNIILPNHGPLQSMSQENASIAAMRWMSDVEKIYVRLGGYHLVMRDNVRVLEKQEGQGKMNEKGINAIASFIESFVNPSVALTNWDVEQANDIIRLDLSQFYEHLMMMKEDYEIDDADYSLIASLVDPVILGQAHRPVNGWEGKNFHTTTAEHHVQNTTPQQQKPGLIKRIVGGMN